MYVIIILDVHYYVHQGGLSYVSNECDNSKKQFFKVIDEAITTHEPICITGKNGNVVILSEEDWRAIQETLYLTSIPGMKDKILKGLNTPLDECVEDNQ